MKSLTDNILLYDAECPLCKVYSKGFVIAGMLDKNGRQDYMQVEEKVKNLIDVDRARNEIALVNPVEGTVKYGIFSLFEIIGHSFPVFKPLFALRSFQWTVQKLYSFVSYNRRVIICGNNPENPMACNPDLRIGYRICYLMFAALVSSFILFRFSTLLENFWPVHGGFAGEIVLVGGQILFQSMVLFIIFGYQERKFWDYLGNLMTVSLFGSILLLPVVLISMFWKLPVLFCLVWFGLVVLVMFLEHKRRVEVYHLPKLLTWSWVFYRMLISVIGFSLLNLL